MLAGNTKVQVYLIVPFKEKDQAKALGARFNPENKQWFVPHGVDVTLFARWLPLDAAAFVLTHLVADSRGGKTTKSKKGSIRHQRAKKTVLSAPLPPLPDVHDDPPWEI